MHPTEHNTRDLGVGEQLRATDFIWMESYDDGFPAEFIPVGAEFTNHILDGTEDYVFCRIIQQSPLEAICEEYGIDTDEGVAILKILLTTAKDINHLLKRKQL
jgi:hypothetical protein